MAKRPAPSNKAAAIVDALSQTLADTYTLRLRTQGVHWNVEGPLFHPIHSLTEEQYNELTIAADDIAERIRALGAKAPASYADFDRLAAIPSSAISGKQDAMLKQLVKDNETVAKRLKAAVELTGEAGDDATQDMLIERVQVHEKAIWMLKAMLG
ncbi:MAG: Dps family protein [Pseudomonadota bacterium]